MFALVLLRAATSMPHLRCRGRTCERYRDAEDCRIGRRLALPYVYATGPLAPHHNAQAHDRDGAGRADTEVVECLFHPHIAWPRSITAKALGELVFQSEAVRRLVGHYEGDTFVVDMIATTTPSRHVGKPPTPAAAARFKQVVTMRG